MKFRVNGTAAGGLLVLGLIALALVFAAISVGIWTLVVAGVSSLLGFSLTWAQCVGYALIITVIQSIFSR